MQDVVPAVGQDETCVPFQFTVLPLFILLPEEYDVCVVPSLEMMNP